MERVYKNDNFIFKLLPCLLITMFAFMCLYGSYTYASVNTEDIENTTFHSNTWDLDYTIILPSDVSNYNYITFFTRCDDSSARNLYLFLSNTPIIVTNTYFPDSKYKDNDIYFKNIEKYYECCHNSYNKLFNSSTFNFTQTASSGYEVTTSSNTTGLSFTYYRSSPADVTDFFSYSNHDIYDTDNNLLFQVPTQEVGSQGIIAEQTQGIQMNKILQEIVAILPIVLVVVVALLAIRKGIALMMAFLRKS